ncbi:MAG: NAD(P)H-hydrate dehydratase [Oscillospiraceae bacterium]|nr:NAD(P)H-hydrate dehydratase [Oscillospiraceae bacterium]
MENLPPLRYPEPQTVLTVEDMRRSDAACIAAGTPGAELMARAGHGVFRAYPWQGPVAILCGTGNNAGDGYVLAALLHEAGIPCRIYLLQERFSRDGAHYFRRCRELGIPWSLWEPGTKLTGCREIADCLFGTGFRGAAEDNAADMIRAANESGAAVISVDINSGLSGVSGLAEGPCIRSDLTVSIGCPQPGHYLGEAKDMLRRLVNVDIGIPPLGLPIRLVGPQDFSALLLPRRECCNKGDFGTVALLGGCTAYSGAAKLANLSLSALRCGCGVARLAVPASLAQGMLPYILESTLYPLPDREGSMVFDPEALDGALDRTAAAALGMGWGRSNENGRILRHILRTYRGSLVLDADGLNTLAALPDRDALLHSTGARVVLTPHLREFSRLTGMRREDLLRDPVTHARQYAESRNVILLLKGSSTLVTDGEGVLLVSRGCAGMATAGSGDVLSGVLAGILGWSPCTPLTVACGAYLAGLAGELAQAEKGDISMLASDTAAKLPEAIGLARQA